MLFMMSNSVVHISFLDKIIFSPLNPLTKLLMQKSEVCSGYKHILDVFKLLVYLVGFNTFVSEALE